MADESIKRSRPAPADQVVPDANAEVDRNINGNGHVDSDLVESASKRVKLEIFDARDDSAPEERRKGVTPIKKEYLIDVGRTAQPAAEADDDAAEASGKNPMEFAGGRGGKKTKGGQNHARQFGSSRDAIELCRSRAFVNEFAPQVCRFGEGCKFTHDLRKYLEDGKRKDLDTFGGICPIWQAKGRCNAGWRCRFAKSHSKELVTDDGRKELVLVDRIGNGAFNGGLIEDDEDAGVGVVNAVSIADKITLRKKKYPTKQSDRYLEWLNKAIKAQEEADRQNRAARDARNDDGDVNDEQQPFNDGDQQHEHRARYIEPPFRASEKRRIYYGPETPVLAPLTTQGNMPYRRLCVSLGAQVTWSEMAMGIPLLQGEKGEWALMKAHESETLPPKYAPKNIVHDYNNSKDLKFGAQIAANKPWLALNTAEVLTSLCPNLRAIDLNCGCPIDMVCRQGAGSALLDTPGKLEKVLRGMNAVSRDVPITVKIRMGTKDKVPTAEKLCTRLVVGGPDAQYHGEEPCGVAAITLHGRSKQQRYTKSANWEYIAECATLVKNLRQTRAEITDTAREPDGRDLAPNTNSDGLPYFCGNGDILSHVDYNEHMDNAGVDSCMIGRGALVKPWIFEEVATNQYLDKSATERLTYIDQFCKHGMEYWGSDEIGVGTTRKFLLEWLSFSCRYVPIGLLEYLPPKFGDRPPAFKGRSDLETLLSSSNYKDWIKLSEMFLGPAHKDFQFQPKHKSNSYEIDAEG
nr:trna-dihydrouridine(47) synthase [nad(p)(+)] [Quercus suber]